MFRTYKEYERLGRLLQKALERKECVPALYLSEPEIIVKIMDSIDLESAFNYFSMFKQCAKQKPATTETIILLLNEGAYMGDLISAYLMMITKGLIEDYQVRSLYEMIKRDNVEIEGYRVFKYLKDEGTTLRSVYYPDYSVFELES